MPDKGSSEYKRKLDQIVDSFVSDPNINLINASAQEWVKGRETAAKLMVDGKYSTYQDRYNLNFNGVDPTTGALQRYNFIGIKPRVDYNKIFEDVAKNTPEQSQDVTVALPDGRVSRRKISIKSKDAILGGINTALAMNPDAIGEMSTELGLDSKGIKKYLNTFATYNQKRETVSEDKFDAGTATYFDNKRKEEEAAAALAIPLQTIPRTDFRATQEELKQYIDDKGNIKPAENIGTGFFDYLEHFNTAGFNTTPQDKVKHSVTQVERLVREKHADVYENFLHARRRSPNAKELALKDTIAYIQEQKEGTPIYGTTIDDKDQRVNIINAMLGNPTSVMLYSLDPNDSKEPVPMTNILSTSKDDPKLIVGAKLTASPYGRDKNSGLPLQNYTVNLNGKPYVATFGTLNPRDEQAQSLYEVENLGKTAIIHNFEPDPLNYPELGNKRVAKMKVYLNRLSNGQYQVCGDDISGK